VIEPARPPPNSAKALPVRLRAAAVSPSSGGLFLAGVGTCGGEFGDGVLEAGHASGGVDLGEVGSFDGEADPGTEQAVINELIALHELSDRCVDGRF
jgi:hypothetical protein